MILVMIIGIITTVSITAKLPAKARLIIMIMMMMMMTMMVKEVMEKATGRNLNKMEIPVVIHIHTAAIKVSRFDMLVFIENVCLLLKSI